MLVAGTALTPAQRRLVCAAFVHRWTHENATQTYGGKCPACEQCGRFPYVCGEALPNGPHVYTREEWHAYHTPLTTDAEWIAACVNALEGIPTEEIERILQTARTTEERLRALSHSLWHEADTLHFEQRRAADPSNSP